MRYTSGGGARGIHTAQNASSVSVCVLQNKTRLLPDTLTLQDMATRREALDAPESVYCHTPEIALPGMPTHCDAPEKHSVSILLGF